MMVSKHELPNLKSFNLFDIKYLKTRPPSNRTLMATTAYWRSSGRKKMFVKQNSHMQNEARTHRISCLWLITRGKIHFASEVFTDLYDLRLFLNQYVSLIIIIYCIRTSAKLNFDQKSLSYSLFCEI